MLANTVLEPLFLISGSCSMLVLFHTSEVAHGKLCPTSVNITNILHSPNFQKTSRVLSISVFQSRVCVSVSLLFKRYHNPETDDILAKLA